jgi:hypothetical protein
METAILRMGLCLTECLTNSNGFSRRTNKMDMTWRYELEKVLPWKAYEYLIELDKRVAKLEKDHTKEED